MDTNLSDYDFSRLSAVMALPTLDELSARSEKWPGLIAAIGYPAALEIMETGRDFTDDERREIQNYRSACEFAGRAL